MNKFDYSYRIITFCLLLVCVQLASCTTGKKEKPDFFSELRVPGVLPIRSEVFPKTDYYVIGEDDVLDISVWRTLSTREDKKEYIINQGDTLEVSVWQWPDLLRTVIVRPDGKISFPLIGDIVAEGKTLTELDNEITKKLAAFIKSPEVSVMITSFGLEELGLPPEISFVKVDELSTEEVVAPDGNIYLPLIGAVRASGLTLNQLRHRIKESISEYVENAEVSISIKTFGGKKVIVLGEVEEPGVYQTTGEVSVLEAISLAGGYTRDAVLGNVIVIRGDLAKPEIFTLNLHKVLKKVDMSQNMIIKPRDIIYVPRTVIAEVNYYVNKLLQPLTSSSSAVTAIKTIRTGPSPKK